MIKAILLASITTALVGCGATKPTDEMIQLNRDMQGARIACYKATETQTRLQALSVAAIPKDQMMMVAMMQQQQEFSKQVIAMVTGNSSDPCAETNIYDVQIQEVKSKNESLSRVSSQLLGMVPWIVGGLVISDVVSNSVGSISAGGDVVFKSPNANTQYNSFKSNTTTNGDGNRQGHNPKLINDSPFEEIVPEEP